MCAKVDKELLANFENDVSVKTVGLIVNPIAGMGGAVGLKGTDGRAILKKARILGAKCIVPARAKSFLSELKPIQKTIRLAVGAGEMGEDEALSCGYTCAIVGKRKKETTAEDTKETARSIMDTDADLLVFCGGDGTARDILEVVNTVIPVLDVPTGVKMHSAVFAIESRVAARVAISFLCGQLPLKEAEVMDVDENAFRKG